MIQTKYARCFSKLLDFVLLILCIVFAEQLLFNSDVVSHSIMDSLKLCIENVIPSLFCFMVLTAFISSSKLGAWISLPMLPLSRLLCLPLNCGGILLMSFLGGYPAGAKALSDAWQRKEIKENTMKRIILFAVCPAPSFAIVTLGCHFLGNISAGLLLYASQILSALFLALLTSIPASAQSKQKLSHSILQGQSLPYSQAIVESVLFASRTMLGMSGYIVLFGVFLSLVAQLPCSPEVLAFISGTLEISGACKKLSALTIPYKLSILSFFLSFGGLSIQFQIKSILKDCPCSFLRLLWGRIVHGLCSAVFTAVLLACFPQAMSVFSSDSSLIPVTKANTPILSLCLIGMMAILLTQSTPKMHGKNKN